jgi:hypothetical protein
VGLLAQHDDPSVPDGASERLEVCEVVGPRAYVDNRHGVIRQPLHSSLVTDALWRGLLGGEGGEDGSREENGAKSHSGNIWVSMEDGTLVF